MKLDKHKIYQPNLNYNGTDIFTIIASDGTWVSEIAEITIYIEAVNDPPIAQDISVISYEDSLKNIHLLGYDLDSDSLIYSLISEPSNGIVELNGDEIIFIPNSNYYGNDSFTYTVSDGTSTDTATLTITVSGGEEDEDTTTVINKETKKEKRELKKEKKELTKQRKKIKKAKRVLLKEFKLP